MAPAYPRRYLTCSSPFQRHASGSMCSHGLALFDLVFPAAPVFLTELQSQDVPDGYPVSFDCVVIGKPPPNVRWYKDGKLLEENDHYMINEDQEGCHQLIITTVLPTDMGVYRCTAENSSGIAATKAELRVDSK
uniref:Ig-like domain-containing protein n=1 Tax=Salarias fasciatus TaxID=181472 RepID=A0A672F5X3_SALFA